MSVNITVNGKFRACNKPSILDDPVRVKKQLEGELRKQRLLEVREESKKLARKIRNDVAAEKDRQLGNLEAIKAQELECWRQHVLDQKNNEYRQAIFQIGTAHNAAKIENEAMAERQAAKEQERIQFKKKTNERIGVKPKQNVKKVLQTAGTQTPNVLMKDKKKKTPKKRRRKICPKDHTSTCQCTSAESESDDDDSQHSDEDDAEILSDSNKSETTKSVTICPCPKVIKCPCTSSSSSSLLSSTCTDEEEPENSSNVKNKNTALSKNPAVIVDIDVDSNDSISITAGEIKDKYAQSNRQFHHIVRNSSPEKPIRAQPKGRTTTNTAKPRFTQVSQILNAKSATSVSPTRSRSPPKPPPPSLAATTASTTVKSPHKSSTSGRIQITLSGNTVTMNSCKSDKEKDARESSSNRVQSYDYNNKYTRDYAQPTEDLVHEPTFRERNGPCAVAQAEMERELALQRDEERKRMSARSVERGRKALEREQARRDCAELTERLDALTQEYPQLLNPTDVRIQNHQLYISREARLEQKRNAAVEDLFLHPAIITCPEINKQHIRIGSAQEGVTSTKTVGDNLNLASPHDQINSSSDSRCSILLGYVDDQKKKIRNDLLKCADGQPNQNKQKAERLKKLLLRIDELRKALCEELEKNGSGDSMQQVINDVSDVRRERERMLNKDVPPENGRQSPLAKHLNDVEQKEAVLEQKLRELCKMQKPQGGQVTTDKVLGKPTENIVKKSDGKECRVQTTDNKPLEIIIKLKKEGSRHSKQKVKKPTKSPRKVSTLIDTPTRRLGVKRSASNVREKPQQQQKVSTNDKQGAINRQNSYDSNSTSYRSLPSRIANDVDALVDQLELSEEADIHGATNIPLTAVAAEAQTAPQPAKSTQRPARLNPLIAHYVQRLLGMSRNSVLGLGVSSSDIETPSSSIMNVSSNRVSATVNLADSQERIQRVQRFIEENRTFISELEDTLRTQSDVTLETSIRMFEEIWQQRLRKEQHSGGEKATKEPQVRQRKEIAPSAADARARVPRTETGKERYMRDNAGVVAQQAKVTRKPDKSSTDTHTRAVMAEAAPSVSQQQRAPVQQTLVPTVVRAKQAQGKDKQVQGQAEQPQGQAKQAQGQQPRQIVQIGEKTARISTERTATTASADSQPKRDILVDTEERRAEEQIARYEQLTENCTQRIAELTELIQKVRTEKKRLMEVTLSSVSEGRNSTEYIELPDGTRRRSNASVDRNTSISSGSSGGASVRHALTTQPTTSIDYTPPDILEQQAAATSAEGLSALDSAAPLEKHKPTGMSHDSGISISRPLTAQDVEPPSQASSTTHPSHHGGGGRKARPPPTLQRYSPNFAEDDVVHELSTIIEVDTPATSRVNATTVSAAAAAAEASRSRPLQPQPFPTFEEYAREMNLDVTQLDADTSQRINQEFETLIAQLCNAQSGAVPDYREFPSLSAYLRNLSVPQDGAEQSQSPETIDDLVSCLRIANLSIKPFPTRQEYLRQLATNSQSGEFLDSASLENISDARTNSNTETESESINIEEELRRRQLLQHSFRTAKTKEQIFSSTVRDGGENGRATHARAFAAESGIEKLSSTSENGSSEFERQLFSLGMKWPATMRARTKEAKAVGNSNSSSSPERVAPTTDATAQRNSPKKGVNNAVLKSPQRSPDSTLRGVSPKRVETVKISATKEVQFERSVDKRSPTHSPTREAAKQKLRHSPERLEVNTNKDTSHQKQRSINPTPDMSTKDTAGHDASRKNKSSQPRSSDCEFLSDFGRPLNLRDFLTKELLKHASSSSTSSTPTDESLRSAFLQSIIETMTPRTNNGGSNQLDRQKTSTPVTHSASSNAQSSGEHSVSSAINTQSQLFSGESCISSVRFFERSITRSYPRNAPTAAGDAQNKMTEEQPDENNASQK
ncbi:uncharacterized protein LOC120782254 [Bactrocera tryoni]|uniref:uncharacterized protein LOC120782254 n=1 Tax=Bactrocera tryoni TaxID=59916 RepID=UPI001A97541F|nr:uncharacterized protein LOC120782254 [Bactrocera tryoni]